VLIGWMLDGCGRNVAVISLFAIGAASVAFDLFDVLSGSRR
jgi:hypothetical protein